ncbi:UNVERIFIED_CONTAM: hypothetical protein FKN15_030132 [Acipenser sinensis]
MTRSQRVSGGGTAKAEVSTEGAARELEMTVNNNNNNRSYLSIPSPARQPHLPGAGHGPMLKGLRPYFEEGESNWTPGRACCGGRTEDPDEEEWSHSFPSTDSPATPVWLPEMVAPIRSMATQAPAQQPHARLCQNSDSALPPQLHYLHEDLFGHREMMQGTRKKDSTSPPPSPQDLHHPVCAD